MVGLVPVLMIYLNKKQYAELREGILLDTTKLKSVMIFISRGLAPRKFVPRIPTNVSKFIKL